MKEDLKQEWHNLQTIFKRERSREEASKVSGSGSTDVYSSSWEYYSQMAFLSVTCNVDESYSSLESEPYVPPKKKKTKNEE